MFLGTMQWFNKNSPLPLKITERFEHYFQHRWDNDRGLALETYSEQRLFDVLPDNTQRLIYSDFLFR